jgi:hypothetical protein
MQRVRVEARDIDSFTLEYVLVEGVVVEDLLESRITKILGEPFAEQALGRARVVNEKTWAVPEVDVVSTITCSAYNASVIDRRLAAGSSDVQIRNLRVPCMRPVLQLP